MGRPAVGVLRVVVLVLAIACAACSEGDEGERGRTAGALDESSQDQLEALGYIAVTEDPVDPSRGGVVPR